MTVANVTFADIWTAILAEHDRLGGTKQNQHHIADKISAVKRKGKSPKFSSQHQTDYEPASDEAGPSSSKRRDRGNHRGRGRGKPSGFGSHHHSHLASQLDMEKASAAVQQQKAVSRPQIALQPSRAGPSTTTIASFKPTGINYTSKSNNQPASAYTGQPSRPGPATLLEARSLAERLDVRPSIENLKALEALREHRRHVEKSRAYADALAAARPPMPPSTSRVEEVPDVVTQANTKDKHPKKTTILKVSLPLDSKGKGKAKETTPPINVSDGDEQLDWGSNDDNVDRDTVEAAEMPKTSWYEDTDQYDPNDSIAYDSIAPQVPFLSIGLIGSLIILNRDNFAMD